jgi:hypothetical protein
VFVGNTAGLPAAYIEGEIIKSDGGWSASNFVEELPAGSSTLYTDTRILFFPGSQRIFLPKGNFSPLTST